MREQTTEVQWEALPVGTYRAQVGVWRLEVRALRYGASDGWGPWGAAIEGRNLGVAPTLEAAQALALRRVPAPAPDTSEVVQALRSLTTALERRMAGGRGDWDEQEEAWSHLRALADGLGLDLAVPFTPSGCS